MTAAGRRQRLFFALAPPHDVAEDIARDARTLCAGLRPPPRRVVASGHLHLTLRFLGQVDAATRAKLETMAKETVAALPPPRVELGGPLLLPSPARPTVLAFAVKATAALKRLAARLEAIATGAGLGPEPRPFHPHITIARLRRRPAPWPLPPVGSRRQFQSEALVLFQSRSDPAGVRYDPCALLPFADSKHPCFLTE